MRSAWRHVGHLHQLHVKGGRRCSTPRCSPTSSGLQALRGRGCRGGTTCCRTGEPHSSWQPLVRDGEVISYPSAEEAEYPEGLCGAVAAAVCAHLAERRCSQAPAASLGFTGVVLRAKGTAHHCRRGTPGLGGLWGCMIAVLVLLAPPALGVRPVKGALVPLCPIEGTSSSRARSASPSLLWAVRCGALVAGATAVAVRPHAAPVLRARAAGDHRAGQWVRLPGLVRSTGRRPRGAWRVFAGRQGSHS